MAAQINRSKSNEFCDRNDTYKKWIDRTNALHTFMAYVFDFEMLIETTFLCALSLMQSENCIRCIVDFIWMQKSADRRITPSPPVTNSVISN